MHTCLDLEDDVFLGNMAVLAFYFSVSFWEWKFRQKMFLGHNCPSEVIFVFKLSVWECKNMFSGRNQHLQQLLFFLACKRGTKFISIGLPEGNDFHPKIGGELFEGLHFCHFAGEEPPCVGSFRKK